MLFIIRILPSSANNIFSNHSTLWVELNIFSLLLTNKYRLIQSKVNCSNDFFFTGLEEGEFDVREGNVNGFSFNGTVSEAVQVALEDTFSLFLANTWSRVQITQHGSFTLIDTDFFLFNYILFCILFTQFQSYLLLKSLHLLLKLCDSC